jgi:DNA-binding LacI/PurR family transcriptional regulator
MDDDTGELHPRRDRHEVLNPRTSRVPVLGYLFFAASIRKHDAPGTATRLAAHGLPLAILDEGDALPWTESGVPLRRTRLVRLVDGYTAGRDVGRTLLRLGHRRIAYISPSHRAPWSKERLAGLKEACREAGVPGAVRAFTVNALYSHQLHLRKDYPRLLASIERILDTGMHGAARGHDLEDGVLQALKAEIGPVAESVAYRAKLRPLLQRARTQSQATAWVGANDNCALECLQYLRGMNVRIPHDVSVVGFDDAFDSFTHELSSYDFNGRAAMQAMVGSVLHPSRGRGVSPGGVLSIDGHLVVRHSLGSAPVL